MRLDAAQYTVPADEVGHKRVTCQGDAVHYGILDGDGRFVKEGELKDGEYVVLAHARVFRGTGVSEVGVSDTDEAPDVTAVSAERLVKPDGELAGEELDERARELDIKGRSEMSADEKRRAVAEAEGR